MQGFFIEKVLYFRCYDVWFAGHDHGFYRHINLPLYMGLIGDTYKTFEIFSAVKNLIGYLHERKDWNPQ